MYDYAGSGLDTTVRLLRRARKSCFDRALATAPGVMVTPTPCYTLGAGDRVLGDTLVVTLTAHGSGTTCAQSLGFIAYTITLFDVPIPVTHLHVEQHGAAGGTPAVLLEQDFQRPKPV